MNNAPNVCDWSLCNLLEAIKHSLNRKKNKKLGVKKWNDETIHQPVECEKSRSKSSQNYLREIEKNSKKTYKFRSVTNIISIKYILYNTHKNGCIHI